MTTRLHRRMMSAIATLAVLIIIVWFWPAHLGGSTRLVIVSGTSMAPTYQLGDLLLVRSGGAAAVGDVVVFAIPEGTAAGMFVVHRVVRIDPNGTIRTRGDNRDTDDRWALEASDIVGRPLVRVPRAGTLVLALGRWPVAGLALGAFVTAVMWPRRRSEDEDTHPDMNQDSNRYTDTTQVLARTDDDLFVFDDEHHHIDPAVMAEAEAWLEEQLAGVTDPGLWTLPRRSAPCFDSDRIERPRYVLPHDLWDRFAELRTDQLPARGRRADHHARST